MTVSKTSTPSTCSATSGRTHVGCTGQPSTPEEGAVVKKKSSPEESEKDRETINMQLPHHSAGQAAHSTSGWYSLYRQRREVDTSQAQHNCLSSRTYHSLMLRLRVFPMSLSTFPGSCVSFCPLLDFSDLQEKTDSAQGQAVQTQYAQKMEILLPKARCRVVEVPSSRLLEEMLI